MVENQKQQQLFCVSDAKLMLKPPSKGQLSRVASGADGNGFKDKSPARASKNNMSKMVFEQQNKQYQEIFV